MQSRILCAAAMALAVAACSKPNDANNVAAADNVAADNAAPARSSVAAPVAAEFANQVAASDRFEIESGNLAATMATSAEVRDFAKVLVTAHAQSTADLKALGESSNPPIMPNDVLDMQNDNMLVALKSAVGADFDHKFIDQQIAGHENALQLLKFYAAGGDNKALKAFASKAVPIVQNHLDKAKSLKK